MFRTDLVVNQKAKCIGDAYNMGKYIKFTAITFSRGCHSFNQRIFAKLRNI